MPRTPADFLSIPHFFPSSVLGFRFAEYVRWRLLSLPLPLLPPYVGIHLCGGCERAEMSPQGRKLEVKETRKKKEERNGGAPDKKW